MHTSVLGVTPAGGAGLSGVPAASSLCLAARVGVLAGGDSAALLPRSLRSQLSGDP